MSLTRINMLNGLGITNATIILFGLIIFGCTETQNPPIHPEGWANSTSENFHGEKIANSGIQSCKTCHGETYNGGLSSVSCDQCHSGKTGHLEGWADPTSENFHGEKIANSGIQSCKACHGETYNGGWSGISCSQCHAGKSGHPELSNWINPASDEYHGRIFWENSWDFTRCKTCHGIDFSGGAVEYSCTNCHSDGVNACYTCHGDQTTKKSHPPKDIYNNTDNTLITVGAHQKHLDSDIADITCDQCHIVPSDPGDFDFSAGDTTHLGSDNIAEITFGTIATTGGTKAAWDRTTATCTSVYCHGNFSYGNVNGNAVSPIWTSSNSAGCGSCHNLPPDGHFDISGASCSTCHSLTINSDGSINKEYHVNGEMDFN